MNQRTHCSSQPVKLPDSTQRSLNCYALAAGAAGVGILALTQPAQARIIYTPAKVSIAGPYKLDLDHDGTNDFSFFFSFAGCRSGMACGSGLTVYRLADGNEMVGARHGADALHAGVAVGPRAHFSAQANVMAGWFYQSRSGNPTSTFTGQWANGGKGVKNRYVGFKFKINGKTHFGWARLSVPFNHNNGFSPKLTGYAYETIANKAIVTGKTRGPDVVVEPATLGHLARGASAISAWRARQ
jgi:hypothetical protein